MKKRASDGRLQREISAGQGENSVEKRQRIKIVLRGLMAVAILGGLYLFVFLTFDVGIPCIFNKLTGLKCPGCGMTHAIASLWKGQPANAWNENALCLSVLPVTCLYLIYRTVRYVNSGGEDFHIWEYVLLLLLLTVTVVYGIMRNITF